MKRPLTVCAAVVVFVSCTGGPSTDRTETADSISTELPARGRPTGTAMVTDSAVGCLEVGAPLDAVRSSCEEIQDTVIHLEGTTQEAAWVEVRGGRALAEIVSGMVWRISVEDPALKTRDSIAVGTPLNRLAGLPGIGIAYEEGTFAIADAHCGMSFEVRGLGFRQRPRGLTVQDPAQ